MMKMINLTEQMKRPSVIITVEANHSNLVIVRFMEVVCLLSKFTNSWKALTGILQLAKTLARTLARTLAGTLDKTLQQEFLMVYIKSGSVL